MLSSKGFISIHRSASTSTRPHHTTTYINTKTHQYHNATLAVFAEPSHHQKMPRRKQARAFSKVGPPTQAQQHSRLLNLPAELRNQIYEYTFSSSPVEISRRSFLKQNPKGLLKSSGLLLACKQIHHEAAQLYYSLTTFYVQRDAEYRIAHWINRIGPLRKALIQNIQLKYVVILPLSRVALHATRRAV